MNRCRSRPTSLVARACLLLPAVGLVWMAWPTGLGGVAKGAQSQDSPVSHRELSHAVPGLPFPIEIDRGLLDRAEADAAVDTLSRALSLLLAHRDDHPRFDEALRKNLLDRVILQPTVANHEGKLFFFLVVRLPEPGRVKLLISASIMQDKGYVGDPDGFAPVLAREFQWVVSKADTAPRPRALSTERDLRHAPIRPDQEILAMSGEERLRLLQRLLESYLRTTDDQNSLDGQPYYEVGATALIPPAQPDSTTKYYDIRIREALQRIVTEAYFLEHTRHAVTSLLNGKIWNVAFVKIDQRDWATRTRVSPAEKAVLVGEPARPIQPAVILVNTYRPAAPDDPFYRDTKTLPMGALSADQLALVIAKEIQANIVEKSLTGHVAQDAISAPK